MAEEKKELDTIIVEDEEGNKKELTIYFTYHSEEFNKDYVIFYDNEDPENLLAAVADEEGNLSDIESDEEYDELDEIIEEFQNNLKD